MYSNQLPARITTELTQHIRDCISDYDYESLENNYGCVRQGLHQALFNECYYIVGTYQAKQWLADCVFEAQNRVREWMVDNFGEIPQEQVGILFCPERLANMVAYIMGEELINNMDEDEFHAMTNYPEEEAC
jgi:hypothetical protein